MDARAVRMILAAQDRGPSDLARQAGVTRKTVWAWQAGRPVRPETAERLTRALIEPVGGRDDHEPEAA